MYTSSIDFNDFINKWPKMKYNIYILKWWKFWDWESIKIFKQFEHSILCNYCLYFYKVYKLYFIFNVASLFYLIAQFGVYIIHTHLQQVNKGTLQSKICFHEFRIAYRLVSGCLQHSSQYWIYTILRTLVLSYVNPPPLHDVTYMHTIISNKFITNNKYKI